MKPYKAMGLGKEPLDPETFNTINIICNRFKNKYSFAHYLPEDIYGEAFIIAMDGLTRYDGKAPLENFLSVHVSNRLKNLVRKHYSPSKQNLVNAIGLQSVDDSGETRMFYEGDSKHIFSKELEEYIDQNLEAKYRLDYMKLLDGEQIIPTRRKALKEELHRIMSDFYGTGKRKA